MAALVAGLALVAGGRSASADPVTLLEQDSQVFVRDDGTVDVIQTLTFRENESQGRDSIRRAGPFFEPIHFNRATLRAPDGTVEASVSPVGGGYQKVDFPAVRTRAGQQYVLELHYRLDRRFADPTSRDGQELLAIFWNQVRWTMPIGRSVIHLVLPLPLPAEVQRHEDITPAMVDGLGVLTDPDVLAEQGHWAFVYTDFEGSRRLTLYAERTNLPAEGVHQVKLYVPRTAIPNLAADQVVPDAGMIDRRLRAEGSAVLVAESYQLTSNVHLGRAASLLLRSELRFAEEGERNFVPAPPVTVNGQPVLPYSTTCAALVDGQPVRCIAEHRGREPVARLDPATQAGQIIDLTVEARWTLANAPLTILDGVPYASLAFVGAPPAWAPRDARSAPFTITLRTGLPLLGSAPTS